jgi:hypothetical protein
MIMIKRPGGFRFPIEEYQRSRSDLPVEQEVSVLDHQLHGIAAQWREWKLSLMDHPLRVGFPASNE